MRNFFYAAALATILFSCGENKTNEASSKPADSLSNPSTSDNTNLKKPLDAVPVNPAATDTFVVTAMNGSGDLGQVSFTQKEKMLFYYNMKTKKGRIVLNADTLVLDKFNFNGNTNSYTLSGAAVSISGANAKFKKNDGSDCNYGVIPVVTITRGKTSVSLEKVDVQDCPDY